MAKQNKRKKQRQFGKQKPEKKPLIDPKHKSTVWTVIIIIILIIFFIVNNTRDVPEEGPYPPNYKPGLQIDSSK